ncbi:MAG: GrpB family protein [Lentisphaeria bacterium]|nr:GrpB family protein [Lentisphaeria bacterium]
MNNSSNNTGAMKLIGGLKLGASAPGDYSFYGDLFSRLPKEVKHAGDLTRYVAFDYLTAGNDSITFLGIEVDKIDAIPDGLMVWDFDGDRLTVLEPGESPGNAIRTFNIQRPTSNVEGAGKGQMIVTYEADVDWAWRSASDSLVGEFNVKVPPEWTGTGSSGERLFSMTANCHIAPGKPGCDDAVELVDYDSQWPEQFSEFSDWLQDCLGNDVALRIEHFGSTAIPGMMAKPIIDVLVQVPSFPEAKQRAIPLFNKKDWEYWWYGDHAVFIKRDGFLGPRTHHVHMMTKGPEFQKRMAFRDWLRSHPEDATEYARLKQRLADCHREAREKYTDAKTVFVKRIVAKANEGKNKEPI